MKKYITYSLSIIATIGFTMSAMAQTDSTEVEEVIINTNGVKVIVKEKKVETTTDENGDSLRMETETIEITTTREASEDDEADSNLERIIKEIKKEEEEELTFINTKWNSFHLGFNNLINSDGKLAADKGYENMEISASNSVNFQWNIVTQAMNLFDGKVRLIYGVSIDYNNYRFENNISLSTDSVPLVATEDDVNYKKNKLVVQNLNVPLLLNFNFTPKNADKGIYLSAGANFGYLIGSHQVKKWEDRGKNKSKLKDDYNLEPFRVGYEVQFGYGNVVLYGRYFPNSIFKDGEGPNLRTVSAGIVLGKI